VAPCVNGIAAVLAEFDAAGRSKEEGKIDILGAALSGDSHPEERFSVLIIRTGGLNEADLLSGTRDALR
jgi:hypothetical protein